jgi:hypothetical protein
MENAEGNAHCSHCGQRLPTPNGELYLIIKRPLAIFPFTWTMKEFRIIIGLTVISMITAIIMISIEGNINEVIAPILVGVALVWLFVIIMWHFGRKWAIKAMRN